MGLQILDQYSLLHFAVGIIAYFWGMSFRLFLLFHTIFEITENTFYGMYLINSYLTFWPGGKPRPDSVFNILGDSLASGLGWYFAQLVDQYGVKKGWYYPHITTTPPF